MLNIVGKEEMFCLLNNNLKSQSLREMVKTIVLRQDPPFRKKTGGLFMYPPSPTLKDGVLFV